MLDSKWFTLIAVVFLVGCISYAVYTRVSRDTALSPNIMLNCFTPSNFDQSCMRQSIDTLLAKKPASELMDFIVASSSPEYLQSNCHAVAHIIGQESYKKTNNMETALSQCTDQCNLGCWHGVIVQSVMQETGAQSAEDLAHADSTEIQKLGTAYCAESREVCHAVGHVVYANSDDVQRSLTSCGQIASGDRANACFQGVFMEAFQNSFSSTSHALLDPAAAKDWTYPCDTLSSKYQHTCFFYLPAARRPGAPLKDMSFVQRVQVWHKACGSLSNEKMRSDCFLGFGLAYEMYTDIHGNLIGNHGSQCNNLSGIEKDSCVAGVAISYAGSTEYQGGLSYCSLLTNAHEKTLCFDVAFQTHARFSQNKTSAASDCDFMSNPQECESAFASYATRATTLPDYFAYGFFK